jgi:hypothetical protein
MKKVPHIFVLLIVLLFCGCENYDLTGEKSILIGKWSWVYSIGTYVDPGDGHHINFNVWPSDINKTFSMEFRDNGKYKFREGDDILYRGKAGFVSWESNDTTNMYCFNIYITNDFSFYGYVYGDTIRTLAYMPPFYFPALEERDLISLRYTSYFVKE